MGFFAGIEMAFYSVNKMSIELKRRLSGRGTETPESLATRINKATYELSFKDHFDKVIVNSDLEKACKEAEMIVRSFIEG